MHARNYFDTNTIVRLHESAVALTLASGEHDLPSRRVANAERFSLGLRNRQSTIRAAIWIAHLHLVEEHVFRTGNFPSRHSANEGERSLYRWMTAQRHATNLAEFQKQRLAVSPAFTTSVHTSRWMVRAAQVEDLICSAGRLPRLAPADSDEYRLARWWNRQTTAARRGKLPEGQSRIIRSLLGHFAEVGRLARPVGRS